ncbi:MAG: Hsp70 family protein [Synechococcales cyanobacterium]
MDYHAIAIDFGTSNTVVCRWDPVTHEAITWTLGSLSRAYGAAHVVPSLLFVEHPHQVVVGDRVRSQRLAQRDPVRFFQGFKRDLLTPYAPPARQIDGESFPLADIATRFLAAVLDQIRQSGIPLSQVILTLPVGAPESYQRWLTDTAQHLQLAGVQWIDEATAAALSYALAQPGSLILVLDFGGGTLDVSLVRLPETGQAVQVIAQSDAYVGGMDVDVWIVEAHLARWQMPRAQVSALAWSVLVERAEYLKIQLTDQTEISDTWFDDQAFMAYELHLTQAELRQILEEHGFLDQVRQCLDDVIQTASYQGIRRAQIDQVILVGGTSYLAAVREVVMNQFGAAKVKADQPLTAVASGALLLSRQVSVQKTLRSSYALRLWDPYQQSPLYVPLFSQGTPYPSQLDPVIVQVAHPGQREIRLDVGTVASSSQAELVYDEQGRMSSRQRIQPQDYRSLTEGRDPVLYLDPAGDPGVDRLALHFAVDAQRTLRVTIRDLLSQQDLLQDAVLAYLT